jgi:hypothetical protein
VTKHHSHSEAAMQTSITNANRAEYAAYALDQYGLHKEGRADYDRPQDMAADMICDLLHLVRAHDVEDPLRMLETARTNFEAEEQEEAAPD